MAGKGEYTLRAGKLHRPRDESGRRPVIRPGDRFTPTKNELKAFSDMIITWPAYLALISDKVEEVEGDADSAPTNKPKAERRSRAKTAEKPESEPEDEDKLGEDPEPGTEPESIE